MHIKKVPKRCILKVLWVSEVGFFFQVNGSLGHLEEYIPNNLRFHFHSDMGNNTGRK